MRCAIAFLAAMLFLAIPGFAQSKIELDLAHHPLEADFPSGGQLHLRIRSAEIHVVGKDEDKIAVSVGGSAGSNSTHMKARFDRSADLGKLRITGGPSNQVTITIQVPKKLESSCPHFRWRGRDQGDYRQ